MITRTIPRKIPARLACAFNFFFYLRFWKNWKDDKEYFILGFNSVPSSQIAANMKYMKKRTFHNVNFNLPYFGSSHRKAEAYVINIKSKGQNYIFYDIYLKNEETAGWKVEWTWRVFTNKDLSNGSRPQWVPLPFENCSTETEVLQARTIITLALLC